MSSVSRDKRHTKTADLCIADRINVCRITYEHPVSDPKECIPSSNIIACELDVVFFYVHKVVE